MSCNTSFISVQRTIEATLQTYRIFNGRVVWDTSRLYCPQFFSGSRLAILDTVEKQNNLLSQV